MIILNGKNNSLANQTKKILKKYNIKLNKNLGQHYLIDDFKRRKIIESAHLNKEDIVLEIGPGIGTLSFEIAKNVKKLIVIEQDSKILKILSKEIEKRNITNIELIEGDGVKVDFPKFNKIISNLPYQISSPITFKFLEHDFDLGILMYQKEFAQRMLGKPSTKNYSRLSAMLYFKSNIEYLIDVSKESFLPKPKVDSTVLKISPRPNNICEEDFENYKKIVNCLFQHKNKKSGNALINSRHIIGFKDKKELKNLLKEKSENKELEELLNHRVINLSPEEILKITQELKDIIK